MAAASLFPSSDMHASRCQYIDLSVGSVRSRWYGTLITTVPGRNSGATFRPNASLVVEQLLHNQ